jgi:hypothetical protein
MRKIFNAAVSTAVLLVAGAASLHPAGAADITPPPPGYGPPDAYGPPPIGYPPPAFAPPPPAFAPLPAPVWRPYAVVPGLVACNPFARRWQCGPWGCGWRPVCFRESFVRPFRPYGPPPPGYGPF